MKSQLLFLLLFLSGCSSTIDAELSLIDQSKRGLAMIDTSLKDRETIAQKAIDDQRTKLDAAFAADTAAHANALTASWVADAGKAYAAGIDALAAAKAQSQQAAQNDADTLDAVNQALDQLTALNQAQLKWDIFNKETK